ncbi:MAG TPA: 4'-phosphopantetheinyl transferase superfamily protein [Streptosporangiaceae bacterium]
MDGTIWEPLTVPEAGTFPAEGVCHLWATPTTSADRYQALLDHAELERAERFKVAHAKDTFIVSRAAQRLVLAHYLGRPPAEIKIARDCQYCGADHGRPYLPGTTLDFNLSHAKGWLLLAVVAKGKVGVDIEAISDRAADDLPDRIFSPAEQHQFLLVDRPHRAAHFMTIWTRKEAAVKLTGHGLAAPFSALDVTGPTVIASPPPPNWPPTPIHLTDLLPKTNQDGTTLHAALATTVPVHTLHPCGPLPSP